MTFVNTHKLSEEVPNLKLPKVLQVEPTNACNFNCIMCIRHFWEAKQGFMDINLFKKIATEAFPHVERVVLYGQGEPLVHPNFLEMVEISKKFLPKDASIFFITNGSLLVPKLAKKLFLDLGVDEVAFSIESTDFSKLSKIRKGIEPMSVFINLEHVASLKRKGDFVLGISTVLMKENYSDLIDLIYSASKIGVDYISVSHIFPYSYEIGKQAVYSTLSRESFEISREIINADSNLLLQSVYEALSQAYGCTVKPTASIILRSVWSKAKSLNIDINLLGLLELREKLDELSRVQKVLEEAKKLAKELNIKLDAPDIFASFKNRSCPYVAKEAMFIRWDGKVVPCMNYAYTHKTYINEHSRSDEEVIFGDLMRETVKEIWNNPQYAKFRKLLKNMNKNIPWCGDCLFSRTNCWFVNSNKMDCYGNTPTCNECLYSVGLTNCLL